MRKKMGRELALLMAPLLIISGVVLFTTSRPPTHALTLVRIKRVVADGLTANDCPLKLTVEWNSGWFTKRVWYGGIPAFPFKSDSWLLDADGNVVATQIGFSFDPIRGARHRYYFIPALKASRPTTVAWKEPLTLQGFLSVDNSPTLKFNTILPGANQEEPLVASKSAFRN